jgi:hypothetical protein
MERGRAFEQRGGENLSCASKPPARRGAAEQSAPRASSLPPRDVLRKGRVAQSERGLPHSLRSSPP